MYYWWRLTFLVVATLVMSSVGCAGHKDRSDDIKTLLYNYREQNKQVKAKRQNNLKRGIEKLEVEFKGSSPNQALVSVDLKEARLEVLVQLILKKAGAEFIIEQPRIVGTVTARFVRRPLVEALAILLRPSGMTAILRGSMVVIDEESVLKGFATSVRSKNDSGKNSDKDLNSELDSENVADNNLGNDSDSESSDESDGDSDSESVNKPVNDSYEYHLTHLRTNRAVELFNTLHPVNENDGTREVTVAPLAETNSIVLSGNHAKIQNAINLLNRIDVNSGHVLLEALVIEFSVQSFMDLGSRLEGGASGEFSNIMVDFANLFGDTVAFTRVADAAHTTAFTAVLNILIEDEDARVVSRPYLATVSGTSADLEIAEDRFVVVETPGGIDVTLEKISSGVILNILPVLTKDDSIALDIKIDESQFIPTLENVELRRSRNTVSSSTVVEDGQTVIIGGLMLKTRADSEAGIPGLRDLPILKYLFGHQDYFRQDSQVMIFVTPHRWSPGMATPVMNQKEWGLIDPVTFDPVEKE